MAITWIVFELVGTLAFAFSGAMVGIKESMDLFGIVVLSIMTAVGGGILRDLMVGNIPVTIFKHPASGACFIYSLQNYSVFIQKK